MLAYVIAAKSSFGPFAIDVQPDLDKNNKINPRSAVLTFLERWRYNFKPSIVVDAGFSGYLF